MPLASVPLWEPQFLSEHQNPHRKSKKGKMLRLCSANSRELVLSYFKGFGGRDLGPGYVIFAVTGGVFFFFKGKVQHPQAENIERK